ncbi:hypothetical protein L6452_17356 [Arctium lappa]|uniref:Uncharacterized protein n=1 Tax=Arctium lappa TaxID=4217 RepID=A0ACB9C3C4_ARCLA|nr:hypothetical protein L6452_17356 [Arctium lappa]
MVIKGRAYRRCLKVCIQDVWGHKKYPNFDKISLITAAEITLSNAEPSIIKFSEDQITQLLSAFWIQANLPDNSLQNIEALAYSFCLTLNSLRLRELLHSHQDNKLGQKGVTSNTNAAQFAETLAEAKCSMKACYSFVFGPGVDHIPRRSSCFSFLCFFARKLMYDFDDHWGVSVMVVALLFTIHSMDGGRNCWIGGSTQRSRLCTMEPRYQKSTHPPPRQVQSPVNLPHQEPFITGGHGFKQRHGTENKSIGGVFEKSHVLKLLGS